MAPLAARDGTLDRMASFAQQLERLLLAAQARGLVESGLAEQLTALAAERERERGWLSLGGVLGRLGAAVTILGVILLLAANWQHIRAGVKILGFLLLLGGAHGAALWIQWTGRPYPRFAAGVALSRRRLVRGRARARRSDLSPPSQPAARDARLARGHRPSGRVAPIPRYLRPG